MTPSELYTHIRGQCAENSTDFWSSAEVYRLMSAAERQIVSLCGTNEVTTTFSTAIGTKEYIRPAGVEIIERVLYDSCPISKISIKQLSDIEGEAYGGVVMSGPAEFYYEYANKIGFSPTPDLVKTVTLYYQGTPAELTSSSTSFSIPQWYVYYLVDYCLYYMFLKDQASANLAMVYKNNWLENLKIIEYETNKLKSKNYTNSPIVTQDIFVE